MFNYKLISYRFDSSGGNYIGILYEETEHHLKFIPIYDNVDGIFLPLSLQSARKADMDYEEFDEIPSFAGILKEKYPEMLI